MEITTTTPQSVGKGGCIILLDVPPGSAITVDGITRLTPSSSSLPNIRGSTSTSPLPFSNGVLIISGILPSSSSSEQFHLIIIRCGFTRKNHQRDCDIRALPVGFILTNPSCDNMTCNNDVGYDWIFARRYDPLTEEISNNPIDELTLNNLLLAMRSGGELASGMLGRNFIMSYDQFMQSPSSKSGSSNNNGTTGVLISSWGARTSFINSAHLQRRHALAHGDKIVPSSYNQEDGDINIHNRSSSCNDNMSAKAQEDYVDGKQISYPRIPCIDPSINARRLTQHAATRFYLSKLSPEIRTKLLLRGGGGGGCNDNSFNAGEYIWNDILSRVYSSRSSSSDNGKHNRNENDFLADIQLSFLMFLFLECHISLEHWRDAISMCSLAMIPTDASDSTKNDNSFLRQNSRFFNHLLSIIHDQFLCIETEFFQEVEYSSGQQNFLILALERLCCACDDIVEGDVNEIDGLKSASLRLKHMLRDRFHFDLSSSLSSSNGADMEIEEECPPIVYEKNNTTTNREQNQKVMEEEYDDYDDEDGPVILPYDEFESSLSRSAAMIDTHNKVDDFEGSKHRQNYPLLFAAMSPQEDVVMCAARVLDEQRDVSLVREAAAYLEEVEAHRCIL
ncbi:hypothetical protein ACHAXM_001896 [Skeletonema potamos]|jgi:A1 cistron-splicing factor AAR2